jgi:STAM-binding protein
VKHWLKAGENHRRAGKAYVEANDLESAFVEYAKAATIVLEKLP